LDEKKKKKKKKKKVHSLKTPIDQSPRPRGTQTQTQTRPERLFPIHATCKKRQVRGLQKWISVLYDGIRGEKKVPFPGRFPPASIL